mmetsp:Transcript_118982/g.237185  ORF Transcript_118982/g.237185 Transcript_118982/m.237185 type:complete len:282 (-) Transcript_118982:48-893(-)
MAVPAQDFDMLFNAGKEYSLQNLSGKWALISGASSGIGKAAACALAASGCNVSLLARRRELLEQIKGEIDSRNFGVEVKVIAGDVNADQTYAKLRESGILDGTDFLVNNAGLALGKDNVGSCSLADMKQMLDANCYGAFRLVNEILPGIISRGGGHVVTTGSIAGLESYEGGSIYCASKAAVHAFMKVLRYETYSKNIRCTTIAPGLTNGGTEALLIRFKGDHEKVAAATKGLHGLHAADIAAQIVWAIRQPQHVCLDMIHVMPSAQGGATRVHRGSDVAT